MLRVAAYCRVSTSQEDQRNSLENQRRYFSEYISRQPDWELVEVYADEGLSGTSSDRPAFRRMLAAAAEEKIDLILTKEVSRFARNTVDTLAYTRLLRRQGVGIVFIGDQIDTRQNDGEFRLTIMASVAQEESRKISERVKWGAAALDGARCGVRVQQYIRIYPAGWGTDGKTRAGGSRPRGVPPFLDGRQRHLHHRTGADRRGHPAAKRKRKIVVVYDGAAAAPRREILRRSSAAQKAALRIFSIIAR